MDIKDYLSETEMKEIATEAFRDKMRLHFADEQNMRRILTNVSYDIVWRMVDDTSEQTIQEFLPAKVKEVIADISHFHLFKKPDAWNMETNSGYQILEREMLANADLIQDKVVESIQAAPKKWVRMIGEDVFKGIVERAITGANAWKG